MARLVELGCISTREQFDCLPAAIKNAELPSALSVEFRVLARAGIDGVDRANAALFNRCAQMSQPADAPRPHRRQSSSLDIWPPTSDQGEERAARSDLIPV